MEAAIDDQADVVSPDLDTLSHLIDSLVQVQKMKSALSAWETDLLGMAAQWMELAAGHGLDGEPNLPKGWNAATVAKRTVTSELAAALRIPERTIDQRLHEASVLTADLPKTMDALRAGDIAYVHAQRIVDHVANLEPAARSVVDEAMHPAAASLTAAQVNTRARKLVERLHPESITERRVRSEADRCVQLEPVADGMAWLHAYLPAEKAVAIHNRVSDIALSLNTAEETRTLAQLRADALTDLLIDGEVSGIGVGGTGVGGTGVGGIRAKVLVTVPVLTLLGDDAPATLEGYGPIDSDTARELAAHAPSFTRLLTHPETGAVLSVGRDSYTVPADLKTWLRVRDETCRAPGCQAAASRCDIDHTDDWADRGSPGTNHDNLGHLCRKHHNQKHHTDWSLRQSSAGVFSWSSPTGREYVVRAAGADAIA